MNNQPQLCAECMENARKGAKLVEQISWVSFYCSHTQTLSIHLCEKRAIVRMQLNGPLTESEAEEQTERVVADSRRHTG